MQMEGRNGPWRRLENKQTRKAWQEGWALLSPVEAGNWEFTG